MRLPRLRTLAIIAALVVAGGFGAVQLGYQIGAEASREAQDRMSVLWPSVLSLPVDDRVVLVKAAMACEVHRLPVGSKASDVAACLRAGARAYDGRHAEDARGPITERLEQLLRAVEVRDDQPAQAAGVVA